MADITDSMVGRFLEANPKYSPAPEPKRNDGMPEGWREVGCVVQEVATNGEWVVFLGIPEPDEHLPDEEQHNCDAMGCGSCSGHVLYRFRVSEGD